MVRKSELSKDVARVAGAREQRERVWVERIEGWRRSRRGRSCCRSGCERSTREYLQVRKTLADPDPLRLAYRQQLHQLVADVVRAPGGSVLKLIRDHARQHVARADRKGFEEMAQDDIKRLHEGVLARYRLRPAEFSAWQKARKLR